MRLARSYWVLEIKVIVILIVLISSLGCAPSSHFAPLDVKSAPPSKKIQHHIVASGETLYSISWRYNIDINKLAKKNRIYGGALHVGQRLTLDVSNVRFAQVRNIKPKRVKRPAKAKVNVKAKVQSKKTTPSSARSQKKTRGVKKMAVVKNKNNKRKWLKPCDCKLSSSFGGAKGENKGIEFTSKVGESIRAVSSGKVVFAGSGLRAYGNLVIIKHTESLLSAYAHNQALLVSEGDEIRTGQKIATMGRSGTDSVKLYFEVRRDGKPINPELFLSK